MSRRGLGEDARVQFMHIMICYMSSFLSLSLNHYLGIMNLSHFI